MEVATGVVAAEGAEVVAEGPEAAEQEVNGKGRRYQ